MERLRHRRHLDRLLLACENLNADILVLTETDERLHPDYANFISTPKLIDIAASLDYSVNEHENRVSIFTDYPVICQYDTYDPYTAVCAELQTEWGNLLVYGTIIGISGNRRKSFQLDLIKQTEDFRRLCELGKPLCICGDFNLSFADNYYFTTFGRDTLKQSFSDNGIMLLTEGMAECIDHIAVSCDFVKGASICFMEWNYDKDLSDHKGIAVSMKK